MVTYVASTEGLVDPPTDQGLPETADPAGMGVGAVAGRGDAS